MQNLCPTENLSPFEGKSMISMHYLPGENGIYGGASRLSALTLQPMDVGHIYEVSFWLYIKSVLTADPNWPEHIGIALLPQNITFHRFTDSRKIPFIGIDTVIFDTWYQVKWKVRPLCNSAYLMIGLFADANWPVSQSYANVNYFIDNVELIEISSVSLSSYKFVYYCSQYEPKVLGLKPKMDNAVLLFDKNESNLSEKNKAALDTFVTFAKNYPDLVFELSGHTDSIGNENSKLSENRVRSVYRYLTEERKLPAFRFTISSMGSDSPLRPNRTEAGRILNRRAEIRQTNLRISMMFYRNALEAVNKKQYEEAYSYLNKWIISSNQVDRIKLLFDPRFEILKKDKRWGVVEKKVREGYNSFKYSRYAFLLDSLRLDDRNALGELSGLLNDLSGIPQESDTSKFVLPALPETLVQEKLKEHYSQLLPIIEKIGWPKNSEFGESAATSAFILLQHSLDSTSYFRWLPTIKNRCEEGEANWMHFAMLYDRCSLISGKPQRYGTHSKTLENGEFRMLPWEGDENTINKYRAEIGIPLLSQILIDAMNKSE